MRCCCAAVRDFADLGAYRRFIDEIMSRKNARNAKRIDAERATLQPLPANRTGDYEETWSSSRPRAASPCEGVLHGALAPDRPSAAGEALRRSGGPVDRRERR